MSELRADPVAVEETSACCGRLLDALRIADAPEDVLEAVRARLEQALALLAPHAHAGPHSQSARACRWTRSVSNCLMRCAGFFRNCGS